MYTYMDYEAEMADRTAQVAEMRMTAKMMAVRNEDRPYHGLRTRLGAFLMSVGRQLSETPCVNDERCSPSAA